VKVEVSYFTSGLTWSMDYVAVTDPDETVMTFDGYVRVFNKSGEEYENAEIRLIVGTINLVEKIADLARRQGIPVPKGGPGREALKRRGPGREALKRRAGRVAFARAEKAALAAPTVSRPKAIVKEGLSEYFMFTVGGTETIRNGWSKRMVAVAAEDVTFDIVYRMRSYQYGPRPVRFFIWRNDAEHKLGESPLPNGRVRIFRDNGREGLSYLGEQQVRYVPIKAEIEVNLGPDDLVVYETYRRSVQRLNFHFRRDSRGREYVDGWDDRQMWIDTIRNYRTKPITLELRRQWNGDVEYDSEVTTTLFDYRTIQVTLTVPARGKKEYPCTVMTRHGVNAKQSRIKLKTRR